MTTFVGDNDHGDTVPTPITEDNGCVRVGKPSEAAVRGWDCFKEPTQ